MDKRLMNQCWPLQMPPTAKSVLMAIASEAKNGVCVPTLSMLMTKTCFEKQAVIDAVKFLESRGALLAERFPGKPTWFTVQPGSYMGEDDPFASPSGGAATSPPNRQARKARIPPGITIHATSDGFQRFWSAYPNSGRRTQLAKCWDVWQRRNLEALADQIERHVLAMAQSRKWREGYEPLTMTYLNGSCWNDPIPDAGPRNEARSYFEETLRGAGGSQATGRDADALRRGVPAEVVRLHAPRNG